VRETLPDRNQYKPSHSTVYRVKLEKGTDGPVWESMRITMDLDGCEKGTENDPKGIEAEVRLYRNHKKIEFRYTAHKEILTDPEAIYVTFPFFLPESRIVFETIGGILTQGQQIPGSSSDWNAAQNFVSVRGNKGQIIVVSNEIPLWHFSDFNMGKFERNPKPGKTWLYSWVMNNYWFTNFRAFQEGTFSWSYQVTSTADTSNTFATRYAWGERNPFPARTLIAGGNALERTTLETLQVTGDANAFLVNIRPSFHKNRSLLLHFRELEGRPAEVRLKTAIPGQAIRNMTEVNAIGKAIGPALSSVRLNPYEVKFIEVEF